MSSENSITNFIVSSKAEQFNFIISVECKSKLDSKKVESLFVDILNQEHAEASKIKKVEILATEGSDIHYTTNGEGNKKKLESGEKKLPPDLIIKTVQTGQKKLQTRLKTMAEIQKDLLNTWPAHKPIIKFFWNFLIYPISLLIRSAKPQASNLDFLREMGLPHDEGALLKAMELSKQALKLNPKDDPSLPLGETYTFSSQLSEAIVLGNQLRKASNKQPICQHISEMIMQRFHDVKDKEQGKNVNLMLIPTGYWKNETTYQPVLLAFYKNPQGKICLSELTYGERDEPIARDYQWSEISTHTLTAFMTPILGLATKPTRGKPFNFSELMRTGFVLIQQGKQLDNSQLGEIPKGVALPLTIEEFREKAWFSTGAELQKSEERIGREERRARVQESPWKILQETIRLQFPEAPYADKALFTLNILENQLEMVISSLPKMTSAERQSWLVKLAHEKDSLKRQWQKSLQTDRFDELMTGPESPFTKLSQNIEALKTQIAILEEQSVKALGNRGKILNRITESSFSLKLPKISSSIRKTEKKAADLDTLSPLDRQHIASIQAGFQNPQVENIQTTLESLKYVEQRMDSLVDKENYSLARELYRLAIQDLPPPEVPVIFGETTFWNALTEKTLKLGNSTLLDEYSNSLGKITQYFWESKVKTWDMPLQGDEWVHMMNTETALVKLIDIRRECVASQNVRHNPTQVPFEDFVLLELEKFHSEKDIYYLLGKFDDEVHLRPSLSPELDAKVMAIRSFVGKIPRWRGGLSKNEIENRIQKETDNYGEVLTAWNNYHSGDAQKKVDMKDDKKLINFIVEKWKSCLNRDTNDLNKEPQLPRQVSDLYRHQLMMRSLLYPDTSIGFYLQNTRGALAFAKAGIMFLTHSSPQAKIKEHQRLNQNVRDRLKSFKRLDITAIEGKLGPTSTRVYGIKERGSPYAKNAPLEIDCDGRSDYYFGGMETNEEIHARSLGNPTSSFFKAKVSSSDRQSEASWLSKELANGKGNTLDKWTLDVLEVSNYSFKFLDTYQYYSEKNIEEIFDLALQNFDLFDLPEEQKRLLAICFRPHLIPRLLRMNPDYFIQRGPLLKKAIEDALANNNRSRATFLLFLTSQIASQAKLTLEVDQKKPLEDIYSSFADLKIPKLNPEKIQAVLDTLPTLATSLGKPSQDPITGMEKAPSPYLNNIVEWLQNPDISLEEQVDLSAYLLCYFANSSQSRDPKQLANLTNENVMVQVFMAANRLSISPDNCFIPQLAEAGVAWAKEVLGPALAQGKPPFSPEKLTIWIDQWVKLHQNESAEAGLWVQDLANPALWKKGNSVVDIAKMQIVKFKGNTPSGMKIPLPSQVTKSADYQFLFGNQTFTAKATVQDRGEYIYQFEDKEGQTFRIFHNTKNDSFVIEQKHEETQLSNRHINPKKLSALKSEMYERKNELDKQADILLDDLLAKMSVSQEGGQKFSSKWKLALSTLPREKKLYYDAFLESYKKQNLYFTDSQMNENIFQFLNLVADSHALQQNLEGKISQLEHLRKAKASLKTDQERKAWNMKWEAISKSLITSLNNLQKASLAQITKEAPILKKFQRAVTPKFKTESFIRGDMVWHRFVHPESKKSGVALGNLSLPPVLKDMPGLGSLSEKTAKAKSSLAKNGIELEFVKNGVWVNMENPQKGFAVLGNNPRKNSQAVFLTFNQNNQLEKVTTSQGMRVVNDVEERLSQVLDSIPSQKILFLSKPHSKAITEIQLVDQGITLKRESLISPWKMISGPYEGCLWVLGGGNPHSKELFRGFTGDIEKFGMTLYNPATEETHFLLWPHRITNSEIKLKDKSVPLELEKAESSPPPVKITIDASGVVKGSSAAYLELAYLFASQHDYQRALHFLNKAQSGRIENEQDLKAVEHICLLFRSLPASSVRSKTIKLKAELYARKIIQQQTQMSQYDPQEWMNFLSDAEYVGNLFQSFKEFSKGSAFRNPELQDYLKQNQQELTLTDEELQEISKITTEGMDALRHKYNRLESLDESQTSFWVEKPSSDALTPAIYALILAKMKESPKKPEDLLNQLTYPDPEIILGHFFTLWNLIIEKDLKPQDLIGLFGNIPGLDMKQLELFKDSKEGEDISDQLGNAPEMLIGWHVDFARKMLLSLAADQEVKINENRFNIEDLSSFQKKLPTDFIGFTWQYFVNKKLVKRQAAFEEKLAEIKATFSKIYGNESSIVAFKEFDSQLALEKQMLSLARKEEKIDLAKLSKIIDENPYLFGPEIGPLFHLLLKNPEISLQQELDRAGGIVPLKQILAMLNEQVKVNLVEELHEAQTSQKIGQLEANLKEKARKISEKPITWPESDGGNGFNAELGKELQSLITFNPYKPIDGSTVTMTAEKIDQANVQITQFLKDQGDEIEKNENTLLRSGVNAAAEQLKKQLADQKNIVDIDQLETYRDTISAHRKDLKEVTDKLSDEILTSLRQHQHDTNLPKKLRWVLKNEALIGKGELLDTILNSYQKMELHLPDIEAKIRDYLILEIELQMLGEPVKKAVGLLETLKKTPDRSQEWQQEWNIASFELQKIIRTATNRSRYLVKEGELAGHLENPRFTRKYLVAELRNKIILTGEQIQIITQMQKDPNNWYELRMGLGKTSYIFPIVLLLLAEDGLLPVGLVKNELLKQNLDSLDKSTRLMLEQAGNEFTFDIKDPINSAILADKYERLLNVKNDNGYILTTIHAKASIEHKLALLKHEFQESQEELLKGGSAKEIQEKISNLYQDIKQSDQKMDQMQKESAILTAKLLELPNVPMPEQQQKVEEITAKINQIAALKEEVALEKQIANAQKIEKLLEEIHEVLPPEVKDVQSLEDIQRKLDEIIQKTIKDRSYRDENIKKAQNLRDLSQLQKEIYWLSKIRELLNGNEKIYGFSTQSIGDEVDDILNVSNEDNLALGEPKSLNRRVCDLTDQLMNIVYNSPSKQMITLANALKSQSQAALRQSEVKDKMMPALVREFFRSQGFKDLINRIENPQVKKNLLKLNEDGFVNYICKTGGRPNDALPSWPKDASSLPEAEKALLETISALKRIVRTMPNALNQNPGINVAIKKSDGFTVGPQVSGQDKEGMIFGDEYDVIINHFVLYACTIEKTEFAERALVVLQERRPSDYIDLVKRAGEHGFTDIFEFLKVPENYRDRLLILRTQIIEANQIKRFDEQYVFNVQESVFGQKIGGMTGTLNAYVLPPSGKTITGIPKPTGVPRVVEGETLIRIACTEPPPTAVVEDANMMAHMEKCLEDFGCKALINEGSPLGNKDAFQVVAELRKTENGSKRTFIFVDPKSRKERIWYSGEATAQPISKEELNRLLLTDPVIRKNCVIYFGPPDTRGTDFKIPPGYAVLITGPTTNIPGYLQADWRVRGLGVQHKLRFVVPKSVADRISKEQAVEQKDISFLHVFNDIKKLTLENQKGLNMKALSTKVTSIISVGVRDMVNQHRKEKDNVAFWDLTKPHQRLIDGIFDSMLYNITRSFLIKPKIIDFPGDDTATSMIDLEKKMEQLFRSEHARVNTLRQAISSISVLFNFALAPFNDNFELTKWCLERTKDLQDRIEAMDRALYQAEMQFEKDINEHKKYLNSTFPTDGSADGGSSHVQVQQAQQEKAQIQQQAQQQTQEQQQQQQNANKNPQNGKFKIFSYIKFHPKKELDLLDNLQPPEPEPIVPEPRRRNNPLDRLPVNMIRAKNALNPSQQIKFLPPEFHDQFGYDPQIGITSHMWDIWTQIPMTKGDPIGRLFVHGEKVFLICREDYHWCVGPYVQETQEETAMGIYSFLNGKKFQEGLTPNQIGPKAPQLDNPSLQSKIVQTKWLIGYFDYSPQELAILKKWLSSLTPTQRNNHLAKCNSDQIKLMRELVNTI